MSYQKVVLLGRLGDDPVLRSTPKGDEVCNFSMATSEGYLNKNGEKKEITEWHKVVVWGKLASVCGKYLAKGRQALVEGKIETKPWTDDEGQKRKQFQIKAINVQFVGGNDKLVAQKSKQSSKDNFSVDDLPF